MTKVIQFFVDVKSELLKVVWPSKNDTVKYTLIVIVFSLVIAGILGSADYGLLKVLQKFINR